MMYDLTLIEHDGEWRVRDIALAERLEYARPADIRELINRHLDALEQIGVIRTVRITSGPKGGAPATEFLLNEEQALYITTKSDARNAQECTILIVRVFAAWRNGTLLPASSADAAFRESDARAIVPLLERLDEKVDNMQCVVIDMSDRLTGLEGRVDDFVPRREFSEDTKRAYRHCVRVRHSGNCPCCLEEKIVDEQGNGIIGKINYDHMEGRERNRRQDGWAVCWLCNQKLKQNDFKRVQRALFIAFHFALNKLHVPAISGPKVRSGRRSGGAIRDLFE